MTVFFTLFSILLSPAAAMAETSLAESQIAEARFKFNRPSAVRIRVQTCNSKGKVRALQLLVKEATLNLNSLVIEYASGGRDQISGKMKLEKGQASAWLPIRNHEDPCLQYVVLNVGASTTHAMTIVGVNGQWEQ